MPAPTAEDLLTRGLFHDRIIPPLHSLSLAGVIKKVFSFARGQMKLEPKQRRRSQLVRHSVPKMKHLRRHFGIPNPYSQSMLCLYVAKHWSKLDSICGKSNFTLSRPIPSVKRALAAEHSRRVEGVRRSESSVAMRYMLKADIASFYPTIYTHSIPWAIHGKERSRTKHAKNWYGNQLDTWVRETQDRQTGGVPIGPDTSFLIAEVIAAKMDSLMSKQLKKDIRGVRYIDDYHLYFATRADAEKGLAALHTVTQEFELQINGNKTQIVELPESIEPVWKTDLRLIRIRSDKRATGIKAFFDQAADLATQFPTDTVLTYAVRKVGRYAAQFNDKEWEVCRSLLLRACLGEPTMLPVLLELFGEYPKAWEKEQVTKLLTELCTYHAPLQQGFEVAWSLWLARAFSINLPESVSASIRRVDDDIVALVALDLEEQGLLPAIKSKLWESRMTATSLYSDHWLLSYEALKKNWLPSLDGVDYVSADPFYSILQKGDVEFYSSDEPWEDGYSDYSDGDDDEYDEDEEDDTDLDEDTEATVSALPHWLGAIPKVEI